MCGSAIGPSCDGAVGGRVCSGGEMINWQVGRYGVGCKISSYGQAVIDCEERDGLDLRGAWTMGHPHFPGVPETGG